MDYYVLIQIMHEERLRKAEMYRLYRQAVSNRPSFAARVRLRMGAVLSAIGNLHRTHCVPKLDPQQDDSQMDGGGEHLPVHQSGQVFTEGP